MNEKKPLKINIFLDDLREAPVGFVPARTGEEAKWMIENNEVGIISFDHDMGVDADGNLRKTGYDLIKFICEKGIHFKKACIHTCNPVGRENIYQALASARQHGVISAETEIEVILIN